MSQSRGPDLEWTRSPSARLDSVRWEDAGHVLAVQQDDLGWSVLRLGLDGTVEYAVAPVAVPPDYSPFRLPLS